MSDVSLLGTGLLGAPVARRLLATGLAVTVWNRTAEKAEALASAGARAAAGAADAVGASPVSVLFLADAPAIRATLLTPPARGALRGRTVIQMGTIGPDESRTLAADVAAAGGDYLEAPVLGSVPQAENGTLQVMVGASAEQVERWRGLLARLGGSPLHVGGVGKAAALKLALNQLIGSLTAAYATSLAYVRAEGVAVDSFLTVLRGSALCAPTFEKKLPRMLSGDYSAPTFPARHLGKDMSLFAAAAGPAGVDARLARAVVAVVARTVELGSGEEDYSAIYRAVASPSG